MERGSRSGVGGRSGRVGCRKRRRDRVRVRVKEGGGEEGVV